MALYSGFYFNLRGQSCDTADVVNLGANILKPFTEEWYVHQTTQTGLVKISLCESNGYAYILGGFRKDSCEGSLINFYSSKCDSKDYYLLNYFYSTAGEYIYFGIVNYSSDTLTWHLQEVLPKPGEVCQSAISLPDTGTYSVDSTLSITWYKITPLANKKVIVSNCGTGNAGSASVYADCKTYLSTVVGSCTGGNTYSYFSTGDEVYIAWYNWGDSSFSWTISYEDAIPGDFCNNAIETTITSNIDTINATGYDKWYKFKPIMPGRVSISNCGLSTRDSYVGVASSCNTGFIANNNNYCGYQSKLSFEVKDTSVYYYVKWNSLSGDEAYKWTISNQNESGDLCSNPLTAIEGKNLLTNTYQWYKYIVPYSGKVNFDFCGITGVNINVYKDCNYTPVSGSFSSCSGSGLYIVTAGEGDTLLIKLNNYSASDSIWWGLNVKPNPAQYCITALETDTSANINTLMDTQYKWYHLKNYGNLKKVKIQYSSCDSVDFVVYKSCATTVVENLISVDCENKYFYVTDTNDYYIKWTRTADASINFNWKITIDSVIPGETCLNPVIINDTLFSATTYMQWFKFTPSTEGEYEISNCGFNGNSSIKIFSDCVNLSGSEEVTLLSESCTQGNKVSFNAGINDYYILWESDSVPFNWTIKKKSTIIIDNVLSNTHYLKIYPLPAKNYIYVEGVEGAYLQLFDINGRLLLNKNILSDKERIDLHILKEGIYFMNIKHNGNVIVQRTSIIK